MLWSGEPTCNIDELGMKRYSGVGFIAQIAPEMDILSLIKPGDCVCVDDIIKETEM